MAEWDGLSRQSLCQIMRTAELELLVRIRYRKITLRVNHAPAFQRNNSEPGRCKFLAHDRAGDTGADDHDVDGFQSGDCHRFFLSRFPDVPRIALCVNLDSALYDLLDADRLDFVRHVM